MTTLLAFALLAAPTVGAPAPDFSLPTTDGKSVSLDALKGKYVVLEWTNKECPFVVKHYGSGSMQRTQAAARAMGATWLSICSSAPGHQGYMPAAEYREYVKREKVAATAVLLDPEGKVGHLYAAKTTPQIVVIDPQGKVVYNGAIDDRPDTDPKSLVGAKNYALQALRESMAGKAVSVPTSRPYGCGVKYKD